MVARSHLALISRARHGDGVAQYALGELYATGAPGMPCNLTVALEWLRRAAAQQHAGAAQRLAGLLTAPLLQNHPQATALIGIVRRLAATGDSEAQWRYATLFRALPDLLRNEDPTAPHLVQQWVQALSAAGHAGARQALGDWLQQHQAPPASLSELDPAAAQALVDRLIARRGTLPPPYVALLLDYYRQYGWHDTRAAAALTKAAHCGDRGAALTLGALYLDPARLVAHKRAPTAAIAAAVQWLQPYHAHGAPAQSLRLATQWLETAAAGGEPTAAFLCGLIYRLPAYSRRNVARSDLWWQQAAEAGQIDAQYQLAVNTWRHRQHNLAAYTTSIQWFVRAARAGHPAAQAFLTEQEIRRRALCDWDSERVSDALLVDLETRHPAMAVRLRLGKALQLKRIEVLLTHWPSADRGDCMVIDLGDQAPKQVPRVIPLQDATTRQLLDRARQRLHAFDGATGNGEGNYRQRLYLFRQIIEGRAPTTALRPAPGAGPSRAQPGALHA